MTENNKKSNQPYPLPIIPNWSQQETFILKLCLQKFGFGQWKDIMKSKCLPDKNLTQIRKQSKKIVGQQDIAQLIGLHLNLDKVLEDNTKNSSYNNRKRIIENQEGALSRQQISRKKQIWKENYGLDKETISKIKLAKIKEPILTISEIEKADLTLIQKITYLTRLEQAISRKMSKNKKKQQQKQKHQQQIQVQKLQELPSRRQQQSPQFPRRAPQKINVKQKSPKRGEINEKSKQSQKRNNQLIQYQAVEKPEIRRHRN